MTLRISGYSPRPSPPPAGVVKNPVTQEAKMPVASLVYKLPIDHIEGTSRGSDIDSQILRRISGTARMIGEGAVRWSLVSVRTKHDLHNCLRPRNVYAF